MCNQKVLLIFIITLISFNVTSQKTIEINSSGYGASEMEAIKNAQRNAIEQTLGAYISSTTLIQNDELVSGRISSIGDGEILEYDTDHLSLGDDFGVVNASFNKEILLKERI